MSPLLEVDDLHVEIPLPHGTLHAVRGVSLTADAGEAVGLVGESGSGKSLTLRALLGLLPQPARITSGRIVLDGVDVTALPARERRRRLTGAMGMIFQDSLTALNPVMRVGEQIAEAPRRKLGLSAAKARARAVELMDRVGIPDPERRYRSYPHELSGGMRQRICIAIALSGRPRLILADEPTTALDVTIQAQVLGVIESLRDAEGVGLILVSHDLAVVSETCRRIYVMYAGRVVENGPILDTLSAPRHPYTFALLRSVPDPDAPVHRLLTISGQPPDLMEEEAGCSFAPRCLFTTDACLGQTPPLVSLPPDRATACLRYSESDRWSDLVAETTTREAAL
jgi:oligopeptide/dipeptide ABC transporter ATP-binding protein